MCEVTLTPLGIPQIEQPRNALLDAVLVPFLHRQIGVARVERRKRALGAALGLRAGLELHRDRYDETRAIRPEMLRLGSRRGHAFLL
jgi:hypothetical protein